MNDSIVLISKDILTKLYLPLYGNKYWNTPNIDALAAKGTIFKRHYTSAPSTAMSFTSMLTGKYPYQLNRKRYETVKKIDDSETLFWKLQQMGYETHILWGYGFFEDITQYANCYGDEKKTVFHNLDIGQDVGPHFFDKRIISRDDNLTDKTISLIKKAIEGIANSNKKVFLWIHLPHVLLGREAYGSDIDLLDQVVGYLRNKFSDDSIFITADHGNMNGKNGVFAYGFDVYEPAINIPLITPRLENQSVVNHPTSNTQLEDIILNRKIPKPEYIISDSAYYAQPNRKTAIVKENYKYIYNKKDKSEELYDLHLDPLENINLLKQSFKDPDRKVTYRQQEVAYYPFQDKVSDIHKQMVEIKNTFWKKGNINEELFYKIRKLLSIGYNNIKALVSDIFASKK
ncbi:MAG: sulfatase-like hydrolase/transferase [Bacilli bacterium]|nr:sulfatase-like hydrolase/transferase [Bacilli bacterium]